MNTYHSELQCSIDDGKLDIGIKILCANVWQAGEIERDIKTLRRNGYTLKSLNLRIKAVRISQYVGIFPNQIHFFNYIYERL